MEALEKYIVENWNPREQPDKDYISKLLSHLNTFHNDFFKEIRWLDLKQDHLREVFTRIIKICVFPDVIEIHISGESTHLNVLFEVLQEKRLMFKKTLIKISDEGNMFQTVLFVERFRDVLGKIKFLIENEEIWLPLDHNVIKKLTMFGRRFAKNGTNIHFYHPVYNNMEEYMLKCGDKSFSDLVRSLKIVHEVGLKGSVVLPYPVFTKRIPAIENVLPYVVTNNIKHSHRARSFARKSLIEEPSGETFLPEDVNYVVKSNFKEFTRMIYKMHEENDTNTYENIKIARIALQYNLVEKFLFIKEILNTDFFMTVLKKHNSPCPEIISELRNMYPNDTEIAMYLTGSTYETWNCKENAQELYLAFDIKIIAICLARVTSDEFIELVKFLKKHKIELVIHPVKYFINCSHCMAMMIPLLDIIKKPLDHSNMVFYSLEKTSFLDPDDRLTRKETIKELNNLAAFLDSRKLQLFVAVTYPFEPTEGLLPVREVIASGELTVPDKSFTGLDRMNVY